ncbi:MAG: GIY-YIG nuclease family protein [Gammaproteobacteria bacterium]
MEKSPCVYIVTNKKNGTLYLGVTTQLRQRIWQHKEKVADGFSKRYELDLLVYYELHDTIESSILREKQLKNWNRQWKLKLIYEFNPEWLDLYLELF